MVERFDAVTFGGDVWRAIAHGELQRPDFQSKGAALAFASGVRNGRKSEPCKCYGEQDKVSKRSVLSDG